MSHYAFRESGRPVALEVDYVVVGSGAGGATMACHLARSGASVCLVEAGAWRDPEHYPSSIYGAMRDLFDDWGSTFTRGRAIWPIVQARTMGGTTVINSAIAVRTPDDIFAQWTREHGIGGPAFQEQVLRHERDLEDELTSSETPDAALGRSNTLAVAAAKAHGLSAHRTRRFVKDCVGSGQCLQGCRKQRKQSLNINFIPETLSRGNVILSCAPVKRVLLDGRRAVGVTGWFRHPSTRKWGASFTVRAGKAVIVACSATHSAPLLQRSKVRSKALGNFFRAHPGTGVFGVYDDAVDMNIGATQGWASTAFREAPGYKLETLAIPPELVVSRLKGGGSELMRRCTEYRHLAMWVAAVRADSVGTVRNGWFDKPTVRYTMNERDMRKLRHGIHQVAKLHVEAGARAVIPGIDGLPFQLHRDKVDQIAEAPLDPRAWIAILSHLFGGCVMGSDPDTSVVDGSGRVHGYENLVVSDASVIPTNLGVNPQLTIMGLARTFGDALLA